MPAEVSASKYKMNVHKSVPDCSKQVENLASWNICVKGIQTLIRELLRGHQHIFLNDIRNCLLTSMKKRKIDLKKSKQGLLCFYWENKTRFQETSIFQKKKKNTVLSRSQHKKRSKWSPMIRCNLRKILGWPESSFGFFCTISQKNPNVLFGQPNIRTA